MNIEVILVNSFTTRGKGGNPAGVVFNADELTSVQKLKIAQIIGYSETAFVAHDVDADFAVSFFTTTNEVDFCGHATLATFSAMHHLGILDAGSYVQRTKAGLLPVVIYADGTVIMEQKLPEKLGSFCYQEVAGIIGLDSQVLKSTGLPIEAVSTGLVDLMVAVPSGYLDIIEPNDDAIAAFCQQHKLVGLHVFELCGENSEYTASCRNFAPLVGISEESATGSACGALASFLTEHTELGHEYVFEQGRAMNCPSSITASVAVIDENITSIKVGGLADIIRKVNITI